MKNLSVFLTSASCNFIAFYSRRSGVVVILTCAKFFMLWVIKTVALIQHHISCFTTKQHKQSEFYGGETIAGLRNIQRTKSIWAEKKREEEKAFVKNSIENKFHQLSFDGILTQIKNCCRIIKTFAAFVFLNFILRLLFIFANTFSSFQ